MIGFLGEYEATLDAKGRFLLPGAIKKQLPEEESNRFVLTRGIEKCLTLYPVKNWDIIAGKINKLNSFEPKVRLFKRLFLNGALPVELDSASRMLIPKNLMEHAGLQKDIVLASQGEIIEIWDKVKYQQLFESVSPDDMSQLAKDVMGDGTIDNKQ